MAWEQWQFWYADMMDQRRKLDQALRRMMNRKVSMAWLRWREWYLDLLDQQFKLAGALKRMMNRKLSMAWEQWQVRNPDNTCDRYTKVETIVPNPKPKSY